MTSVRMACVGIAALAGAFIAAVGAAEAKTCSERVGTCERFCDRSEPGVAGCKAKCGDYFHRCVASGCWESRFVAKECGFARR